eukprot:CAMPEP_0113818370 /NCGR_PEP_ID=MMETSP0328-20130328/206_1 /TAXON_ID=39455 /ORGANISM="Alexandrium minutum" /LENGTH=362 /DNA_ID=CAMNT_0000786305 /DNA_START=81 /DNA_END=1169 /DNA_ORIENTATION=+ /assembly_acc=CAM_ASM_000350
MPAMGGGPDAYAVLGLPEDAEPGDIRRAFRSLALRRHPDKSPPEARPEAESAFKELIGAYDLLRDPERRSEYDVSRRSIVVPLRRCSSSSSVTVAHSRPCTPPTSTRPRRARKGVTEAFASVSRIPRWGWCTSPTFSDNFQPLGVATQNPGSVRVWFARGSTSIGRAQDGLEADGLADVRLATLQAVGQWAACQSAARIDIRGCSQRGEVCSGARAHDALGLARCEKTLAFLTARCGVPAEKCHASRRLGGDFQGVEIRSMMRLEVEGSFQADSGPQLKGEATLDIVVAAARKAATKHLMLEVQYSRSERVAQRRVSALRQALTTLGIPQQRICGRVQAGLAEEVSFLLYEELSPPQDSPAR